VTNRTLAVATARNSGLVRWIKHSYRILSNVATDHC
jgi:hypothetical protein